MSKIVVLSFTALIFAGCGGANQQTVNNNIVLQNATNSAVVSSHSQTDSTVKTDSNIRDNSKPVTKSETKTKWTQSGEPIDVSSYDGEIKQVQDKIKANPKDETLKKSLVEIYIKRGVELTDARQYASALGDYRRALKLDSNNEEAKKWIAKIIEIYDSINRTYPQEGEEPPPLPFKKEV